MKARYNVVFVGKTGTGKSALINYLYGDEIMKTSAGKPVTQQGFYPADCEINGLPVRLFDSWGLEVGKDQEWMRLLNEELKKRDTNKPVEEWFHTVFYCIGAGGHRIEPFDTQIMKRFIQEKYKVAVILTKADIISLEQEKELKDSIQNDVGQAVPIIPVCSLEQKFRNGNTTEKFGKEDVELQAYNDFWDSIILRLSDRCEKVVIKYIDRELSSFGMYEKLERMKSFSESLKKEDNPISNLVINEVKNSIETYGSFSKALNYPPKTMEGIKSIKFNLEIPKTMPIATCISGQIGSILLSTTGSVLTILSLNPLPALIGSLLGGGTQVAIEARDQTDEQKIEEALKSLKKEIKKIKPPVEQLLKEIRDGKAA